MPLQNSRLLRRLATLALALDAALQAAASEATVKRLAQDFDRTYERVLQEGTFLEVDVLVEAETGVLCLLRLTPQGTEHRVVTVP